VWRAGCRHWSPPEPPAACQPAISGADSPISMVCEGLLIVRPIWICPEMGHPKISLVCHFFPGVYCTLLRRETPMWYVRFMHHHTLASLYHHTVMVCISKPQIGGYIVPLSNYLTAKSCLVAFFLVPQSPSRVLKPRGLLIWHFAQDVSKDHAVENLLAWKVLELGRSVERVLLGHRGVIPHRYLNVYIYIIISLSLCVIYTAHIYG